MNALHLQAQLLSLKTKPVHKSLSIECFVVGKQRDGFGTIVEGAAEQDLTLCDITLRHGPKGTRRGIGTYQFLGCGNGEERFLGTTE